MDTKTNIENICEEVIAKNAGEPEFHQAVREVVGSLGPVLDKYPEFAEAKVVHILHVLCKIEIGLFFAVWLLFTNYREEVFSETQPPVFSFLAS